MAHLNLKIVVEPFQIKERSFLWLFEEDEVGGARGAVN